MQRLHSQVKRRLNLSRTKQHRFRNVKAKHRKRTFSTEVAAKEYAKNSMKLENGSYTVMPAKKNKRFKILTSQDLARFI